MRRLKDEEGQILVLTLISATLLMGFMALAIDVGVLFRARRNMQIAADAAAMAGAMQLYYGPAANVTSAAQAAAKLNGVDSAVTGNTVIINSPPVDGPNITCKTCVEAQVATPNQTFFMGLFLPANSQTVAARAVAGAPGPSTNCGWIENPTMSGALDMQGAGSVTEYYCGIYVNSKSATAVKGANVNGTDASLNIVGPDTAALSMTGVNVNINVTPVSPKIPLTLGDPRPTCTSTSAATEIYPAGSAPKKPSSSQASDSSVSGASADSVVCFTNSVTLDSGVVLAGATGDGVLYVFEQGVTMSGTIQVGSYPPPIPANGQPFTAGLTAGATIDVDGGNYTQGGAQLSVFAPTKGTYSSVAIMQPQQNTTDNKCPAYKGPAPCMEIQKGAGNAVIDGIIFAPKEGVELQDGGGGVTAIGFIVDDLYIKGSSNLSIYGYSQANPTTTPFTLVTMVE